MRTISTGRATLMVLVLGAALPAAAQQPTPAQPAEPPRGLISGQLYRLERERAERRTAWRERLAPLTDGVEAARRQLERVRTELQAPPVPPPVPPKDAPPSLPETMRDRVTGAGRFVTERLVPQLGELGLDTLRYLRDGQRALDEPPGAASLPEEMARQFLNPRAHDNARRAGDLLRDSSEQAVEEMLGPEGRRALQGTLEEQARRALEYLGSPQFEQDLHDVQRLQEAQRTGRAPAPGSPEEAQLRRALDRQRALRSLLEQRPREDPAALERERRAEAAQAQAALDLLRRLAQWKFAAPPAPRSPPAAPRGSEGAPPRPAPAERDF